MASGGDAGKIKSIFSKEFRGLCHDAAERMEELERAT